LIEIFTSVADRRLGILIVLIVISAVTIVVMMGRREHHLGFIDDPAVKVPQSRAEPIESAASSAGERYMTQRELGVFMRWRAQRRIVVFVAFLILSAAVVCVVWFWMSGRFSSAIMISQWIGLSVGILLCVSNSLAFIALPLRSALGSILLVCCFAANTGAMDASALMMDASTLMKADDSSSFPSVSLIIDGHSTVGHVIFQTASNTLLFDPLRQFILLPNSRISETRYVTR
jgi:hypothetical protein